MRLAKPAVRVVPHALKSAEKSHHNYKLLFNLGIRIP
jgi:hypothetical protein